jgi:hypothetical protein
LDKLGLKKEMIKKLERMSQNPLLLETPETPAKSAETPQVPETRDKSPETLKMLMKKPLIKTKKMRMIIQCNTKLKHLTQEFTKLFNVIIPWINILGSLQRGVTTHSPLANFSEHYSFVSSLEPPKVEEALDDADWVMAMQEELNNFTRNEVWSLV